MRLEQISAPSCFASFHRQEACRRSAQLRTAMKKSDVSLYTVPEPLKVKAMSLKGSTQGGGVRIFSAALLRSFHRKFGYSFACSIILHIAC